MHRVSWCSVCWLLLTLVGPYTMIQIHLDVSHKSDVYQMYQGFCKGKGLLSHEYLGLKSFLKMWANEFPHVRVRRKSTIASKCQICEDLEVSSFPLHREV